LGGPPRKKRPWQGAHRSGGWLHPRALALGYKSAALRARCVGLRKVHPKGRQETAETKTAVALWCYKNWYRYSVTSPYSRFGSVFREAAEKLKARDRIAPFPAGSFPPSAALRRRVTSPAAFLDSRPPD
jgi:hypothetical protein